MNNVIKTAYSQGANTRKENFDVHSAGHESLLGGTPYNDKAESVLMRPGSCWSFRKRFTMPSGHRCSNLWAAALLVGRECFERRTFSTAAFRASCALLSMKGGVKFTGKKFWTFYDLVIKRGS